MSKIYCLMGKSSCGKDTIYKMLMADEQLSFEKIVPYTTRPIRAGEREGVEYHFTDKAGLDNLSKQGKVIECRCYNTVHGDWYYFTVDDGSIQYEEKDYLIIGTLESYNKMKEHFGNHVVQAIYIEVDDGVRLERALSRERSQESPKYAEMCRRFLADTEDFSEEKIEEAGITDRFYNDNVENVIEKIKQMMK